jgi:hypothetical protein
MNQVNNQPIDGRSEFQAAVKLAFAEMAAQDVREVWLCDDNFADWPLGERAVIEHLTQWVASNRRLTLMAKHFNEVPRRHPRWVAWRRQWSHVVQCRSPFESEPFDLPCLLLAPGALSVVLFDPIHCRGRAFRDAATETQYKAQIDAFLQHSEEAFPVTTAGL